MRFAVAFFLLLSFGARGYSQTKACPAIEKRMNECLNGEGADGSSHDAGCIHQAADAFEKEINRVFTKLKKGLPASERASLIESQRKWEAFKAAELDSISLLSLRAGTVHRVDAASARLALLAHRLDELCRRFAQEHDGTEFGEELPEEVAQPVSLEAWRAGRRQNR